MPSRSRNRKDDALRLRLCVAATALEFGALDLDMGNPLARGPLVDLGRQVAMSLGHSVFGMTHTRIGQLMARDRSTVAHGCAVVEDERDCPIFSAKLERLEGHLRSFTEGLSETLCSETPAPRRKAPATSGARA